MTSTIIPGLLELKKYESLNIVDVGAARASFLVELEKIFDLSKVFSIGIDPVNHGVSSRYTKFYQVCVDNVDSNIKGKFFKNSVDDQAGSLSISTDDRKDQFDSGHDVDILNLETIINEHLPSGTIHFIKIDAEGRDMHIVKSLSDENLKRTKFISVECSNYTPRFEGECVKSECIDYMKEKNFFVFHDYNAEHDPNNGLPVSDVIFANREEI